MGKSFKCILRELTNGATNQSHGSEPAAPKTPRRRPGFQALTPEQRLEVQTLAHAAMKDGLTVFMSKDTIAAFCRILNVPSLTSTTMRRVLEEVAKGTLTLTKAGAPTPITTKPVRLGTPSRAFAAPTVLSVDQLSAGMPFSLKQAAKILNVKPNMLYFRCVTGRIHFERDKSRYYIPASEVQRLQVVGL